MEYLRWILLVAGITFILLVYLMGRRRRRKLNRIQESTEDLPEFSAQNWDAMDEGVGEVRIVARDNHYDESFDDQLIEDQHHNDVYSESSSPRFDSSPNSSNVDNTSVGNYGVAGFKAEDSRDEHRDAHDDSQQKQQDKANDDIIMLYILANSPNVLYGDKINSAAQANGLVYGEMNIFHSYADGQTQYSMANMVEPGSFDPNTMHDLHTPGLIVFMQISAVKNADDVLDDMLQSAYRMSEMLGAQLCNTRREPISQRDAEQYRERVAAVGA